MTYPQLLYLIKSADRRQEELHSFQAALQGIDLKKSMKKSKKSHSPAQEESEEYLFKDPSAYEKMTQEEREAETQRIMGKLKNFFGNNDVPVGM